jgi:hypothetical protein
MITGIYLDSSDGGYIQSKFGLYDYCKDTRIEPFSPGPPAAGFAAGLGLGELIATTGLAAAIVGYFITVDSPPISYPLPWPRPKLKFVKCQYNCPCCPGVAVILTVPALEGCPKGYSVTCEELPPMGNYRGGKVRCLFVNKWAVP